MIDGTPANLRWITPPDAAPVIGISEAGDDMHLLCLFGSMSYSRSGDSEALAKHLEQVAQMVRGHA